MFSHSFILLLEQSEINKSRAKNRFKLVSPFHRFILPTVQFYSRSPSTSSPLSRQTLHLAAPLATYFYSWSASSLLSCSFPFFSAVCLQLSPTAHSSPLQPFPFLSSSFLPGLWRVLRTGLDNSRSLHIWTRWWNRGMRLSHDPPSNTLPFLPLIHPSIPPPFPLLCHHFSPGSSSLSPSASSISFPLHHLLDLLNVIAGI